VVEQKLVKLVMAVVNVSPLAEGVVLKVPEEARNTGMPKWNCGVVTLNVFT
jgi:hypothetical protein